ncbi:MAG: hypothetical protein IKO26_06850 [Paludibacteraceae bacterium]|nr:hypothetical protein [Paludibacteraceae bacterium]
MKRLFNFFVVVVIATNLIAQEQIQFNAVNHETNTALRYKLYPTFNMWTYLKLDTQTGRVTMLQYSTNSREEEGEIYIGIPMEVYVGSEAVNGRYELYPTTNMWTFLMIDQVNGNTYHIQWSNKDMKYNQLYRIN